MTSQRKLAAARITKQTSFLHKIYNGKAGVPSRPAALPGIVLPSSTYTWQLLLFVYTSELPWPRSLCGKLVSFFVHFAGCGHAPS